ncbi:hypothetical protein [Spiroplasma endosymbiont of Polydrusus formosus]|uniref:hypothetical protein n=1 Tax=Spiroplasma endosymbiont of Polydrusus formosus TaxID=3139326 RepID=UPI0035B56310
MAMVDVNNYEQEIINAFIIMIIAKIYGSCKIKDFLIRKILSYREEKFIKLWLKIS